MTTKIRVKVGDVEVDYEGPESYLDKKLPEFISQLSKFSAHTSGDKGKPGGGGAKRDAEEPGSLAIFLQKHGGAKSHEHRFLLTAQWLHLRGVENLTTADVSKALRDNHQSRLANPSDCLNRNVRRGFCEKTQTGFFVTEEGSKAVG
jgi:hypothetical protein